MTRLPDSNPCYRLLAQPPSDQAANREPEHRDGDERDSVLPGGHSAESTELRHGDALLLLREVETETVDLVLTDPPYSSGGMFRGDRAERTTREKYVQTGTIAERHDFDGDSRDQRGFLAWASLWLADCWRATRVGGSLLVFTDWRQLPTMTDAVQAGGWIWRGIIVWDKTSIARPRPGFSSRAEYIVWGTRGAFSQEVYLPGVIVAAAPRGDDRRHITEKPIGLLEQLVAICPPGGLVLDPFRRFRLDTRRRPESRTTGARFRAERRAPGNGRDATRAAIAWSGRCLSAYRIRTLVCGRPGPSLRLGETHERTGD